MNNWLSEKNLFRRSFEAIAVIKLAVYLKGCSDIEFIYFQKQVYKISHKIYEHEGTEKEKAAFFVSLLKKHFIDHTDINLISDVENVIIRAMDEAKRLFEESKNRPKELAASKHCIKQCSIAIRGFNL